MGSPAAVSQEGVTLMRVAHALDNFACVSRTRAFMGWDESPVCGWTGVICSPQQSVIGVNFTRALPPSQAVQPNVGHAIMLTGMLCHPNSTLSGVSSQEGGSPHICTASHGSTLEVHEEGQEDACLWEW